ncbi:unnamed protein product [Psylliodes chrysocephalus]|uniref:Uncharacterized protein n=1 Tax=Psylliodes chrysocephalus TaxID=3402493 RepID=A0A9P0CSG6_9CUCU|nr:unnamed protein product [Psylliodes chrysocephala]
MNMKQEKDKIEEDNGLEKNNKETEVGEHAMKNLMEIFISMKFIEVYINDSKVKFKFDSASDVTIIDDEIKKNDSEPTISQTNQIAKNSSGEEVKLTGIMNCQIAKLRASQWNMLGFVH